MKKISIVLSLFIILVTSSIFANGLQRLNSGVWNGTSRYMGFAAGVEKNFWVDIQVPNYSYHKTVGIVWTDDNWATVRTAYAAYESTMDNGLELWGLDIVSAGEVYVHRSMGPIRWTNVEGHQVEIGYPNRPVEIKYAIFYNLPNGSSVWDNNNGNDYIDTLVQ